MCRYYLFYAYVWVQDVENVETNYSTALLLSKDANGLVVDTSPLPMGRWYSWSTGIELKSMFILPLEDTGITGLYYDYNSYPIIVIQMTEGGYLEVTFDTFYGDWDFDQSVTFEDYNMLLAQMGKNIYVDEDFDMWYDGNNDGVIDESDVGVFMSQWLEMR